MYSKYLFYFLFTYLLIYPYIFRYYLEFKSLFIKKKEEYNNSNIKYPKITILIPAYNESNIIIDTLNALSNLDYPDFDIIIIDDCSEDNTDLSVKKFIKEINLNLKYIKNEKRLGKLKILNNNIPNINNEFILVLDANIHLEKNSLKNIVEEIDDNTGIVFGNLLLYKNHYSSITDEEINYWKKENLLKEMQCNYGNITSPVGGFYILKKELFQYIPDDCNMEDMYILLKILEKNKNSKFSNKALAYEKTEKSTISEFKRKRRIISGAFFIIKYLIFNGAIFKLSKIDSFEIFLNKILRWIYPIIYSVTFMFSFFLQNIPAAKLFNNINIIIISLIIIEFLFNSCINILTNSKNVRVQVLKTPLYFYTLIFAGISGFLMRKNKDIWVKDNR